MPIKHAPLDTSAEEMQHQEHPIKEKMPIYVPRDIIVLQAQVNQRNALLEHLRIRQVDYVL